MRWIWVINLKRTPIIAVSSFATKGDEVLSSPPEALSPRLLRLIIELNEDWRRLDERLQALSAEVESLSDNDAACQRLMTVPGIGPIISSAVVAAIGTGSSFKQGANFAAAAPCARVLDLAAPRCRVRSESRGSG
jgi:transposase